MIVTAEPYFAVSQPGNLVVAESTSISGASTDVDAKYELAPRGTYSATNSHINDAIFGIDPKTPLELFEARNAVRIAHIATLTSTPDRSFEGRPAAVERRRHSIARNRRKKLLRSPRKKRRKRPKKPA